MPDRASPTDRAFLAMDNGDVPEQFGVVLGLDDARDLDLDLVRRLLGDRVTAVPRLRQRLMRTPVLCGGPVWVDDASFDIRDHVREMPCGRSPGDRPPLEEALELIVSPLPRDRPLWAVFLLTRIGGGVAALVVVLHHALADGVGGLAVLGALVDEGARRVDVPFPQPPPRARTLARDAFATRAHAVRDLGRSWRLLRASMAGGGGLRPPRAGESSLIQRTGPRRRVATVSTPLPTLRRAAHRLGVRRTTQSWSRSPEPFIVCS